MFPQVSPSLFALDFASLTTIAFCAPFVFMVLRIAFPATPLDSHLYKLPGGCGGQAGKTVGRVCAMDTNKPAFINLQTLYRCEKGCLVRFQSNRNPLGKTPGVGYPRHSPTFRISLLPRRQNRFRGWQVAPYPAGCHNSPLHTKHPAMRVSLARQLSLLLLGVTHGCTR